MTYVERSVARPRVSDVLTELRDAQKHGAGVPAYTRWVNRRAARVLAALAVHIGAGPSTVSLVSAAVSALGLAVLLAAGVDAPVVAGVVTAILLALGYVLDSADGQVARVTGTSSRAGEWLDHVIDAIRTPAIHLAVAVVAVLADRGALLAFVALVHALVSTGQFMSQILAEQLVGRSRPVVTDGGVRRSLVLLPTDTGTLCWVFVLWGAPGAFTVAYVSLTIVAVLHSAVSLRRRHLELASGGTR